MDRQKNERTNNFNDHLTTLNHWTDRVMYTDRLTKKQTDRQTDQQTDRQDTPTEFRTDKVTDRDLRGCVSISTIVCTKFEPEIFS